MPDTLPDWIAEHEEAHERLRDVRRAGGSGEDELAEVRRLEHRDGWLFIHLFRCAIVTDPSLLRKWLSGPAVVGPWKLPAGVCDSVGRHAAQDNERTRDAVSHVFSELNGLKAIVRALERRVDDLTPGVGEG